MLEVSASRWKQSDQASDLDSIERKIAQFIRVFDFNDEKSVKILFYILSKTEFNNYSYEFINGATSLICSPKVANGMTTDIRCQVFDNEISILISTRYPIRVVDISIKNGICRYSETKVKPDVIINCINSGLFIAGQVLT